ncbi:MAG: hypothetical protein H6Q52_530 [Deltaproteobacteria bacterium]|nr:hypothetical protein [Deltaproteobacteria bacterium]
MIDRIRTILYSQIIRRLAVICAAVIPLSVIPRLLSSIRYMPGYRH